MALAVQAQGRSYRRDTNPGREQPSAQVVQDSRPKAIGLVGDEEPFRQDLPDVVGEGLRAVACENRLDVGEVAFRERIDGGDVPIGACARDVQIANEQLVEDIDGIFSVDALREIGDEAYTVDVNAGPCATSCFQRRGQSFVEPRRRSSVYENGAVGCGESLHVVRSSLHDSQSMNACPSDEHLANFIEGRGPRGEAFDAFQNHVADCRECRRVVAAALVVPLESQIGGTGVAPPEAEFEAAERIGRYVVLEPIGAGAMGVVYLGYDPELERKIAIKVLRHAPARRDADADADADADQGFERMLREAKAMAHASTPFTVAVHDAGVVNGRVFIAMEFVDGATLTKWLGSAPRSWREVVRLFAECARALATAHGGGIVHRDFKPDNVLVAKDGHAKVTDFGLARPLRVEREAEAGADAVHSGLPRSLLEVVTQHGALVGTPAYMAPELLLGGVADARSDQFSFCVSLYEALVGKRPFAGKSIEELRASVLEGRMEEALKLRAVPFGLRRAVLRGLSPRPEDRHPSMAALLQVLEKHLSRTRTRWLLASLGVTVGLAFLAARAGAPAPPAPCAHVTDKAAATWDDATRSRVRASFLATGRPFAEDAFHGVDRAMSEWLSAWSSFRARTCEDTFVRHEQSEELFDLRMRCLDERWLGAQALARTLSTADGEAVESAVQAAFGLETLSACEDSEGLRARVRPPSDPGVRRSVDLLASDLASTRAKEAIGRYAEAASEAKALVARARTVPDGPTLARSLLLEGELLDATGDYANAAIDLREAAWAAMGSRDDDTAMASMAKLVSVVGYRLSRDDEARFWDRTAEATLEGRKNPPLYVAMLEQHRGSLARSRGLYDEARTHLGKALDLQRRMLGEAHPEIATIENVLAYTLTLLGDFAAAESLTRSAITMRERALGKGHPLVAQSLSQLGLIHAKMGRYDEALAELRSALTIERATFGEDHLESGYTMNRIGNVLLWRGDAKAARDVYVDVLALGEKRLGKTHPEVGLAHMNLAIALEHMNLLAEAEAELASAKSILVARLGAEYPYLATVLTEQGVLRQKQRRHAEAERLLREALGIVTKTLGKQAPDYVESLVMLASELDENGHGSEASRLYEEALAHPALDRAEPHVKALASAWKRR